MAKHNQGIITKIIPGPKLKAFPEFENEVTPIMINMNQLIIIGIIKQFNNFSLKAALHNNYILGRVLAVYQNSYSHTKPIIILFEKQGV